MTAEQLPAEAAEVLAYWFGSRPAATTEELQAKLATWFGVPAEAALVRERFGATIEAARAGGLAEWEGSARGKLALLLVLDQFMRSYYGMQDAEAFAEGARAERLSLELFDGGIPEEWSAEEHFVALIPLGHSEDLAMHRRAMAESMPLVTRAPLHLRPMFETVMGQLLRFMKVVERFGRFPHRNAALGRESTAAELEFLKSWAILHLARDFDEQAEASRALERVAADSGDPVKQ